MAFKFMNSNRSSSSSSNFKPSSINISSDINNDDTLVPKLTNAQLNKLTKVYPTWLRDNSNLKRLPGVYQGVLGQVQLQPDFANESRFVNGQILALRHQQLDYMNRFTDTQRVHQLLSASHLSNETLATIWAHVNKTFPGKLTNREVCLALALIALFQNLELDCNNYKDDNTKSTSYAKTNSTTYKDPFILIKSEKTPPVPTLYPSRNDLDNKLTNSRITTSKSMPDELSAQDLLIDICSDDSTKINENSRVQRSLQEISESNGNNNDHDHLKTTCDNLKGNLINLIDMNCDRFEIEISQLSLIWIRFLSAMKIVFKRSFDILNVENSRQSSIEALSSCNGIQFIKNLSVCYPLAHNIRFKIDELKNIKNFYFFDKNYIIRIDDLMTSINEYWAVLINLFHESGQIEFIELIMDGLNYKTPTVASKNIDELANEMNSVGRTDLCSICHTKFHQMRGNTLPSNIPEEDIILLANSELITLDNQYYYHARCANFWLYQVDSSGLPFHREPDAILRPSIKDNLGTLELLKN